MVLQWRPALLDTNLRAEAVRMAQPVAVLPQGFRDVEKPLPVPVIPEDSLPGVAPGDDLK